MDLEERERKSCSGLDGELCIVFFKGFKGESDSI